MNTDREKIIAISKYIESFNELKRLNVIKNQKDFTSQIGEWIASIIYGGELAKNGKQKDWDLKNDNDYYQIKSHAKSSTSNRKDTDFKYSLQSKIDYLIIIIFDENYKIDKIFRVPFKKAYNLVNRENKNPVLNWSVLEKDFSENLENIYKQNEILRVFKKEIL